MKYLKTFTIIIFIFSFLFLFHSIYLSKNQKITQKQIITAVDNTIGDLKTGSLVQEYDSDTISTVPEIKIASKEEIPADTIQIVEDKIVEPVTSSSLVEANYQAILPSSSFSQGGTQKIVLPVEDGAFYLDLNKYNYSGLSFVWEGNPFQFSISNSLDNVSMSEVELTDDMEDPNATRKISNLYSGQISDNQYLVLNLKGVSSLEVDLYDVSVSTAGNHVNTSAFVQNFDHGVSYTTLNIKRREEWSNDPDINNPGRYTWDPVYYPVEKIIVHHTAMPNDQDPIEAIRQIYNYHTYTNGWGDIGYNYLIDPNGQIYEGKAGGEETMGYHAGSNAYLRSDVGNHNSIGIALMGTFTDERPTAAALDSLKKLIAEKSVFYEFTPQWQTNVFGHRDYMATSCPGQALYDYLPTLTVDSANYADSHFQQIKDVVAESNNVLAHSQLDEYSKLTIKLNNMTNQQVEDYIPAFSGVENAGTLLGSQMYLEFKNSVEGVPWSPYDPSVGIARMKTLYKVYSFDSNVVYMVMGKGQMYTAF